MITEIYLFKITVEPPTHLTCSLTRHISASYMGCISLIKCIRVRVRVRPTGYMCSNTDIVHSASHNLTTYSTS